MRHLRKSKPQRLEAASFAESKLARVELVPFPVIFVTKVLVLENCLAAPYILPKRGGRGNMTQQDRTRQRRVIWLLVTTAIGSAPAGYIAFRFAHSRSTDARTYEMFWLVLCGLSMLTGLIRFLRRNKRNPFEEEMAHRRSLVRNDENPSRLKAKS